MGADRIIAVNVGTGLLPKEKIKMWVNVSEQLLSILVQRNVTDEAKTFGQTRRLHSGGCRRHRQSAI